MKRVLLLLHFFILSSSSFGFSEFEKLLNKCQYNQAFSYVDKLPSSAEKTYYGAVLLLHFGALEKSKQHCYKALSSSKNDLLNGKIYQLLFDISYYLTEVDNEKLYADSCYHFYKKLYGANSIYKAQYNINLVRYYNYFRRSDLAEPFAQEAIRICNSMPSEKFKIDYPMVFAQYYASFRNDPTKISPPNIDSPLVYCDLALDWHTKINGGIDNFSKIKLYHLKGMVFLDKNTGFTHKKQWSLAKKYQLLAIAEFEKANKIITKNLGNTHILLSFGNAIIGLLHQQQEEYELAMKYYSIAENNLYPTKYSKQFYSASIFNVLGIYDWMNSTAYGQYDKTKNIKHLFEAITIAKKAEKFYETMLITGAKLNDYFSHIPYPKLASLYYQLYCNTNKNKYLDSSYYYAEKEKITEIQIGKLKDITNNKQKALTEKLFVENEILANNKYLGIIDIFKIKPSLYNNVNWFEEILNIKEIQSKITDDSTTILLFTHYNNPTKFEPLVVCFAISKSSFKHTSFVLTLQHALRYSIDSMMISITSSDINTFKNTSNLVYKELFKPIRGILPTTSKKLLICPVSRFRNFPFEILIEDTIGNRFGDFNYLIRKYAISYLISPSLTFSQKKRNLNTNMFVFNPEFKNANQAELPFNLSCSHWLASQFTNSTYCNNATKSNLIEGLQQNGICHLATHANGFDDYTNESRIYTNDKPMMLSEVYKFQLPYNPFVILTCCEADKGNLQFNLGNDNFSRAFSVAGASSVLSTLWSIDDQASAEMMKHFYQNLSNGMDKSIALQQAKLSILNNETLKSSAPFYWAASVLTGDISPIELKVKSSSKWVYFLAVATILLGLFIYRKKLFSKMTK